MGPKGLLKIASFLLICMGALLLSKQMYLDNTISAFLPLMIVQWLSCYPLLSHHPEVVL